MIKQVYFIDCEFDKETCRVVFLLINYMKEVCNQMKPSMLTTTDNPHNPFKAFNEWYAFDEAKGYHTCSYLARIANISYDLSDADFQLAQEQAIDEIVNLNILGIYKRVYEDE